MVERQKIIAMTKLALYDKHEGAADRAANEYFRHDYIYRKNLGTRIAVGIGGILILAIYWAGVLFVDGVDVFKLDIQAHARDAILFVLALTALYSLFGTIQGTREYYLIQKRLKHYQGLLRLLENKEEKKEEKKPVPVTDEKAIEIERRTRVREKEETPEERERRIRLERRERELRAARTARSSTNDPLANVSARALNSTRPRSINRPAAKPDTNIPKPRTLTPPQRKTMTTKPAAPPVYRLSNDPPK